MKELQEKEEEYRQKKESEFQKIRQKLATLSRKFDSEPKNQKNWYDLAASRTSEQQPLSDRSKDGKRAKENLESSQILEEMEWKSKFDG